MSPKKCVKAHVLLRKLSRRVVTLAIRRSHRRPVGHAPWICSAGRGVGAKGLRGRGRRFSFEPATIDVVEGDTVRLLVRSADGPHGVEIKAFKVKKAVPRAKPGDSPVTIEFVAAAAGEYPILCSEYCGNGHKDMTGTLIVRAKPKGDQ